MIENEITVKIEGKRNIDGHKKFGYERKTRRKSRHRG